MVQVVVVVVQQSLPAQSLRQRMVALAHQMQLEVQRPIKGYPMAVGAAGLLLAMGNPDISAWMEGQGTEGVVWGGSKETPGCPISDRMGQMGCLEVAEVGEAGARGVSRAPSMPTVVVVVVVVQVALGDGADLAAEAEVLPLACSSSAAVSLWQEMP